MSAFSNRRVWTIFPKWAVVVALFLVPAVFSTLQASTMRYEHVPGNPGEFRVYLTASSVGWWRVQFIQWGSVWSNHQAQWTVVGEEKLMVVFGGVTGDFFSQPGNREFKIQWWDGTWHDYVDPDPTPTPTPTPMPTPAPKATVVLKFRIKNFQIGVTTPIFVQFNSVNQQVAESVGSFDAPTVDYQAVYTDDVANLAGKVAYIYAGDKLLGSVTTPVEMLDGHTYEVMAGGFRLGGPNDPDDELPVQEPPDMNEPVPTPSPAPPYATPTPGNSNPWGGDSGGTAVPIGASDAAPGYHEPTYAPFGSGSAPGGNPGIGSMSKDDFYDAVRRGVTDAGTVAVPAVTPVSYTPVGAAEGETRLMVSIGSFVDAYNEFKSAFAGLAQKFDIELPSSVGGGAPLTMDILGQTFEVDLAKIPGREWIRGLAYLFLLISGFLAMKALIRGAFVDQS